MNWLVMYAVLMTSSVASRGGTRTPLSRVVTTKYGAVRGHVVSFPNRHLQQVEVFLGVPYATAPTGSLRFMPPVTPPHWRGVRMADKFGPVCPQRLPDIANETEALKRMPAGRLEYLRRLLPFLQDQNEDCLYLNIYAPANSQRDGATLPVMMYIHGESYEWNSGNPYDGSVLASFGNVVVITFNFRLGVLGFLPTLDGYARGNYGLMDQVAALHWVRENIYEFGGDHRNITIFGHGYGAACVNMLMLSPMAKGLFHRAIMQSGSALSSWAVAHDGMTYSHSIAKALGCPIHESAALVECMRQQTVEDIMKVQITVPEHLTGFGPTVDGTVLPKQPAVLMEDNNNLFGQYDLLFGVTRIESYFQFSAHEDKFGIEQDRRDRLLRTLVRNLFTYHLQEIFLTVVNEYTDWTRPVQHPINVLDGTADALGDALVVAPLIRAGNYHSIIAMKTFFYVFAYQAEGNFTQRMGCIHGEDMPYVFGAPLVGSLSYFNRNYTRSETALSEAVMMYWTNFAKVGDPNIQSHDVDAVNERGRGRFERFSWQPYDNVHQKYVMIGMKPKVRDHYHAHRLSLWLQLIPKLHQAGSTATSLLHHKLQDHDNPISYDGYVREVRYPPLPSTTVSVSLQPGVSAATPGGDGNDSYILETPSPVPQHPTARPPNASESMAVVLQSTRYSTALSVTIAVGCSLLILNVLIFAGVYYQRDKNRLEEKLHKRNYKVHKPTDAEQQVTTVGNSNKTSIRAPPPSPIGQTQMFQAVQPPSSDSVNNLPPKVPPKPILNTPQGSVPETQPLLPCGAVRTPLVRAVNQQEMRVQPKVAREETTV